MTAKRVTIPEMVNDVADLEAMHPASAVEVTVDLYAAAVTAAERLAKALVKLWNACMDADADDGLGEAVDGSLLDEVAAVLDDLYPNWRDRP